ncbi:MAG: hypothetical protein NTZ90_13000 [Proteobacteria bacterium]|nr:hypothetical protein [Pseudomonadota bacterium]
MTRYQALATTALLLAGLTSPACNSNNKSTDSANHNSPSPSANATAPNGSATHPSSKLCTSQKALAVGYYVTVNRDLAPYADKNDKPAILVLSENAPIYIVRGGGGLLIGAFKNISVANNTVTGYLDTQRIMGPKPALPIPTCLDLNDGHAGSPVNYTLSANGFTDPSPDEGGTYQKQAGPMPTLDQFIANLVKQ